MASKDTREFISKLEKNKDLIRIKRQVDWNLELIHVAKLTEEKGGPALLFENVKDYDIPVLTSQYGTLGRFAREFDMPPSSSLHEITTKWVDLISRQGVPPKKVGKGPVFENIIEGDNIDLLKFPVPKFYPDDGGRYICTNYCLVTKDPDTGWVNLGTYRGQLLDKNHVGLMIQPGKHGWVHMEKWAQKGKKMPVAAVFGGPPVLFTVSGTEAPFGVSEYDIAGAIAGFPIEVVISDLTDLPIPADAEIVLEGEIDPDRANWQLEGPFGEATGYYSGKPTNKPVFEVKRVLHRNSPIYLASTVGRPITDTHIMAAIGRCGRLWKELKDTGIPGIKSVAMHPASQRFFIISVKQMYPGHSKQVLSAAASTPMGSYANKLFITVDDDIEPDDWTKVLWSVIQRFDPDRSVEILKGRRGSYLDPGIEPKLKYPYALNSTLLVDGCIPYHWQEKPEVIRLDAKLVEKIQKEWKEYGLESLA